MSAAGNLSRDIIMPTLIGACAWLPYSAKFLRHLYFVDWPLKAISLHNVRGMTANRKPRLKSLHVIAGNLTIFVDLFSCRILTHEIREN